MDMDIMGIMGGCPTMMNPHLVIILDKAQFVGLYLDDLDDYGDYPLVH